jgi:hypothetical protein
MSDDKTNEKTDYTNSTMWNQDSIKINKFSLPKRKTQSTPTLSYSYTNKIRKDIFGEVIKKGGKHKISFADNALSSYKTNVNNIENKLKIYWNKEKIDIYKSKLLTLQNLLISYKNKDTENAEINKLRNKGNELSNQLINAEKKLKTRNNSDYLIKPLNLLKDELTSFIENPTKEIYKNLETKINNYIKIIADDNLKIQNIIFIYIQIQS